MPETQTPNEALARIIEESGLRKGFIAKQLGIGPWTLSYWLSGRVALSDADRRKLGLFFRRDPGDFISPERVDGANQTDAERAA